MKVEALAVLFTAEMPVSVPVHVVGANESLLVGDRIDWRVLEAFSMSLWLSQKPRVTLECSVPGKKPQGRGKMGGEVVGLRSGRCSAASFLHSFILSFTQQIRSVHPGWPLLVLVPAPVSLDAW